MAVTVRHLKTSLIPDGADTSLVLPSDWNANHTIAGLGDAAEYNVGTGSTNVLLKSSADSLYFAKSSPTSVDPSGFPDRTQVTLSWSNATRTLTITPVGSTFDIWVFGVKWTKTGVQTFQISNTTGAHYVYYGTDGELHETTTFDGRLIFGWAYVSEIWWDSVGGKAVPDATDERHGTEWPAELHYQQHVTVGTRYQTGIAPTFSIGTGASASDVRFSTTSGTIWDEDIPLTITAHAVTDTLPWMYRTGASNFDFDESGAELVRVGGSGFPQFNNFSGTWGLSEVTDGYYTIAWVIATNGLTKKVIVLAGQGQYATQEEAETAARTAPNLTGFPSPELKTVAAVVIQADGLATNGFKSKVVLLLNGSSYIDWRYTYQNSAVSPGSGGGGNVGVAIGAGGSTYSTGTVPFGNANGFSFVTSNGSVVGSYTQAAQTADTQKAGTGFTSAGAGIGLSGTLNTNGLSLSATVPTQSAQPVAYSAANGSANFSTLSFANSNGVSFSTGTQGLYATVAAQSVQPVAFSASGGSSNFSTLNFTNSNGITFSNTNGSVRVTHDLQYTSNTSNITSNAFAASATTKFAGTGTTFGGTNVSGSMTVNSNGVALSMSVGAGGAADGYNSAQFTNSTANSTMPLVWAGNSNGSGNITMGLTGSTITAQGPGGGVGDGGNIIAAGGSTANSTGTIVFSNSNNVSFGLNGGTVTATATFAQSVDTNKAGTGFSSAGNNIGLSGTLNTNGLSLSATVAAQSVQPVAYSAANGSANFSTLTFANSNGVSFSTGTQGLFATVKTDYLTTARASTDAIGLNTALTGNGVSVTANSSGLSINVPAFLTTAAQSNHSHGNPTLALTNLSGTTASASNGLTLSLSAAAPGGNIVLAGSNGALTNTSFQFGNLNGLSFYTSNGSIVGSYTDAGAGAGISAVVITAGTTNNSVSNFSFSNTNGVSFGINGSTITASVNAGGGSTISNYVPFQLMNNTSYSSFGQNSLHFQHFVPTDNVSLANIELYARGSFVSSTNAQTYQQTISYGIYSQDTGTNNTRMTLMGSSTIGMTASYNSNTTGAYTLGQGTNSITSGSAGTALFTNISGPFHYYMPFSTSLQAGVKYAVGLVVSSATTGNSGPMRYAPLIMTVMNSLSMGKVQPTGITAPATSIIGDYEMGVYTVTSGALVNSYATSNISIAVSRQKLFVQLEV